jgi:hypothetical protein
MKCDWIFLKQDDTVTKATLEEPRIPSLGDGKNYGNKDFQVVFTGSNLISRINPVILATEIKQNTQP